MSIAANTPKAKAQTKGKPSARIIHAIAIKPSPLPETDEEENLAYKILFVTADGKQKTAPCTKSIFQQVVANRLTADHRNNFRLRLAADNATVQSIDKYPKPELNTVFKAVGEEDQAEVVLQRHKDKTFTLKSQPQDVSPAVVDEITELIHAHPDVDVDDFLDGRYQITGITKKGGAEMIFVNPTAK